jgi:predicted permease
MIKGNEFRDLSDSELLQKRKAVKSGLIVSCVIMGFLVGIAIYSVVRNGIGFFTFFPLFFVFLIGKNQGTDKALLREIKSRNLE